MGDEDTRAMFLLESRLQDPRAEPIDLTLSLLRKITNNFSDSLIIGSGGFGVVYKGELSNGMVVAVKKVFDDLKEQEPFYDEATCLIRADHRNIVRLLGFCAHTRAKPFRLKGGKHILADVRTRLLCFEYVPGSLHSSIKGVIVSDRFAGLEWHWHQRYRIIMGICQGLHYLHDEQRIIHLDLKPQNILLDQNMVPKITDFGLSRIFGTKQTRIITNHHPGTDGYMAPEYIKGGVITFKSDIYSLGVVLLQVMTGTMSRPNIEDVLELWRFKVEESQLKQVKICAEIAIQCTEDKPEDRPSINGIIERLGKTESSDGCTETGLSCSTVLQGEMASMEIRGESSSMISQETATSTELLAIHPKELRFPFEANKLITCPLHLQNITDHRVAFILEPRKPKRYYDNWLGGYIPPKSTYTLIVTMRHQQSRPDADEFQIRSSVLAEEDLNEITQGKDDNKYYNFIADVEDNHSSTVHKQTLASFCVDHQGETNIGIIPISSEYPHISSMDVHPAKPWIITSHYESHFYIWDYQRKVMVRDITPEQKDMSFLTAKFIEREQRIMAGGYDGRIHVYNDDNTMKQVKAWKPHSAAITSLAIHPNNTYVLSASYNHDIELRDWTNIRTPVQIFKRHTGSVYQIAFNPMDANTFASAHQDKTIKIWSLDSPRPIHTLTGHSSQVRCLDYFNQGDKQFLITGSDDTTAKIWDLQTNKCVGTLEGHTARVSTVCSHPMLPKLMTGSFDGTVRLWNSTTFRLEGILNFGLKKVHAFGCSMKDSRVMIGHRDGLVILEVDREGHFVSTGSRKTAK